MEKTKPKIRDRLFRINRRSKRAIHIASDVLVVPISFLLAFYMRLEAFYFIYNKDTYIGALIALATVFSVYATLGLYNSFTRHVSIDAVYIIAFGSALSCTALFVGIFLFGLEIPRSVPIIFAVISCVLALGTRLFVRALGQNLTSGNRENVAIFGAGTVGKQLMDALRQGSDYRVRLFIDDNPELSGRNINGVPIKSLNHAKEKFEQLKIDTLLLAMPGEVDANRRQIFDILSNHSLKVKTIPSISSLISGGLKITDLKDIKVEDLLGREPVIHNTELMAKNITGKVVLVTGAGGSIGSQLCRHIIKWKPKKLIMLDVSEFASYEIFEELKSTALGDSNNLFPLVGSVQDRDFLQKVFKRFRVDTAYHAAAYKHVPLMEQNVMQCISNNVFGTLNMAELAIDAKVSNFILVSSDKAVRPTNFMGASKRLAEIICQTLPPAHSKTCFSTVRFGNVLGSSGSVVPLFKKQIANGGPVMITHPDITRYFMTISEAAELVIQAGSIANRGEVCVLDMGKPIKIIELAQKMVTLAGYKPVLNSDGPLKEDEIAIIFSGLRAGEKLFEELTYDGYIKGTDHPRINIADEIPMQTEEVMALLDDIRTAIKNSDHKKLYSTMASITDGVSTVNESNDVFIERNDY